ncbi:MAG: glycoside hydrolase family 1 protein [Chloroflexi bacterium]|nr:glycoside hydrolase family 1 protein [Chloroflexota bacterium]
MVLWAVLAAFGLLAILAVVGLVRFIRDAAWLTRDLGPQPSFLEHDTGGPLSFPLGFLWGAATAAHQVEGGNTRNDWSLWEQGRDSRGRCRIADCQVSGQAADQFHRFRDDFDLAAKDGHTLYRLSLEWSRLEPEPFRWAPEAVAHYRAVLLELRKRDIQPMVTLFHFTSPSWLAERGGWEAPEAVEHFERYARFAGETFGDLVDLWVTVNEPAIYALNSYLQGLWPPGKTSARSTVRVMANLALAHRRAYQALHEADQADADGDGVSALVGIAQHIRVYSPLDPHSIRDRTVARFYDFVMNEWVLDVAATGRLRLVLPPIAFFWRSEPGPQDSLDFLGVNYYSRDLVAFDLRSPGAFFGRRTYDPSRHEYSELGRDFEIYPSGLYSAVKQLHRRYPGKPIYITENGVSDNTDKVRGRFILEHLYQVWRALQEGAPVRGYAYWSLTDNFEWELGFTTRFGLYRVDWATLERVPTRGSQIYATIVRANALPPSMKEMAKK